MTSKEYMEQLHGDLTSKMTDVDNDNDNGHRAYLTIACQDAGYPSMPTDNSQSRCNYIT